jgi:bidirectional [NiFe] hydrogenase diaphorase subunit
MESKITIRIDGELVRAEKGSSIFEAAQANGKRIPGLCNMKGLKPVGACRLCMVEVAGVNRLLPSCTTPAQEGMSVTIRSSRLDSYRKQTLELLLSERNHVCAVCVSNGHCELQTLSAELGVTNVRYGYRYPKLKVDLSHPRYVLDHNRCILCTRCVRVCAHVEGAHVWDIASRGIHSMVTCEMNRKWGESRNCTSCGKCVQVCPTGALAEKGFAVEEMVKRSDSVQRLAVVRGGAK